MPTQHTPKMYGETTLAGKLLYVAAFCVFGFAVNLLALELPQSTPLLLGNLAFVVVMLRFGFGWGLACALIVLLPVSSAVYWACSLLQLLTFIPSQQIKHRPWLVITSYFVCTAALLVLQPLSPMPPLTALLSALMMSFSLVIFKHCAQLFLLQSVSSVAKRQLPLKQQLASHIAVMAVIPWTLLISLILYSAVVLNLSGYIDDLISVQSQLHSQLKQKLTAYQAELRLASGYIPFLGEEQSLRQLVQSQPEFISALRTDASGTVLSFFTEQATQDIQGYSVAQLDYFQQPATTGQAYISDVFQGLRPGSDLSFGLSLPIYEQQKFSGVLELSVALDKLITALQLQKQDDRLQVVLMDSQQTKIWGHAAAQRPGQKLSLNSPMFAESKPYLTHSPLYSHHQLNFNQSGSHIRLYNTIEGTQWPLFLLWDYSHLALRYQLMTLVALLAMLAGIELCSRSSQRFASGYTLTLQQLSCAIESMKAGSVQSTTPELDNSALEFEQLLSSFLSFQQRQRTGYQALQSALEDKTNLSLQLEQSVLDRTAELSVERDKAQQLAQVKTRFLANMSHELRTPLTIILGFIQQIMQHPDNPQRQNQLQAISNQSEILLQIVNDILDAGRMNEGKLPLDLQHFDLQPLLCELHQSMLPVALEKQLNFSLNYRYPLPCALYSDPLRLKQILIHLLGNALKFTQQGEVRLSAEIRQGQLQLCVSDTGPGIDAKLQQKLFAAFEQGDPGVSRQFGGTGLGLYICKQLSDLLGYQLVLHSIPDVGSTFTLIIPLPVQAKLMLKAPQQNHATTDGVAQQQIPQLNGSVLIVDDVPDLRLLFSTLLAPTGLQLQTAQHGLDALKKVAQQPFDLILMDMHMPVMDGLTATLELRSQGYQMPVIALTADIQSEQKQLCLKAGCHTVLTKPVQPMVLYKKIAELLPAKQIGQPIPDVQQQLENLAQLYRDSLPSVALELEQLIQLQDPESTAALLHRIKGTSACFGFSRISALAAGAEEVVAAKQWPKTQLNDLLHQIQQEQP